VGRLRHYQCKSHQTITIRGKTRCVSLYYDISKHCTCPLNKFIYSFKVVNLFFETLCIMQHRWLPKSTTPINWKCKRPKQAKKCKHSVIIMKLYSVLTMYKNQKKTYRKWKDRRVKWIVHNYTTIHTSFIKCQIQFGFIMPRTALKGPMGRKYNIAPCPVFADVCSINILNIQDVYFIVRLVPGADMALFSHRLCAVADNLRPEFPV
jgi:hypothetical protein